MEKMIEQLKIIQHNVRTWSFNHRNEFTNDYYQENPDIILLNDTGIVDSKNIKIHNYNIIQKNFANQQHSGIAIATRKNLKYKTWDDFDEDFLAIEIETNRGPIAIATTYLPPRRPYMPQGDIGKLMRKQIPTYIIGDINGRHPIFGNRDTNNKGSFIAREIDRNNIIYYGPDFSTLANGRGRPDIVLGNRHTCSAFNYSFIVLFVWLFGYDFNCV